jgi:hypothetical protein
MLSVIILSLLTSLSICQAEESEKPAEPFAFGDFTWMNGQNRQKKQNRLKNEYATFMAYVDTYINHTFSTPKDNVVTGSSTIGRNDEFQVNLATFGLETNYENVIGRVYYQTGSMLNLIQETDGTQNRGRNLSNDNLKNIREATVGYHFDSLNGINAEAGIFMSYMGLESYLTQENWSYQRSQVCEFTPFYFQGARLQIHPTDRFKIEPWLINGFQTYGKWNRAFGVGLSNSYRPTESLALVANFYYGSDQQNNPGRKRFHHDHSILSRYYNNPGAGFISKAAFSLNNHYGFENGGNDPIPTGTTTPFSGDAYFLGTSLSHRLWFNQDKMAFTLRGGYLLNQGRYLAITPVASTYANSWALPEEAGLRIWDITATWDLMPSDLVTFRFEYMHRHSNIPYFAGPQGTTSPDGWNGTPGAFTPDLQKQEDRVTLSAVFRI